MNSLGCEVLVVTSDRHPEPTYGLVDECVIRKRSFPRSVTDVGNLHRVSRRFQPDVIFEDVVDDPVWLAARTGAPRLVMIHDAAPHDAANRKSQLKTITGALQLQAASGVITFSRYVEAELVHNGFRRRRLDASQRRFHVPLISDLPDERAITQPETSRHGFLVLGRVSAYKGLDFAIEGWQLARATGRFRDESLDIISSTEIDAVLPDSVRAFCRPYRYANLIPELARYRACLLPYSAASQSGVQVLALQNFVPTIVTNVGGLPEYQPKSLPPVRTPAELATQLRRLADDNAVMDLSREARAFYDETCGDERVGEALELIVKSAASGS